MINIGQRIKDELAAQERSVSWLARKLNCTRALVYRIFDKNSIDTALLQNISLILGHNFFLEFVDDFNAASSVCSLSGNRSNEEPSHE